MHRSVLSRSENNLQIFDLCVIVKGRDVTEEEEIELLPGENQAVENLVTRAVARGGI